MDSGQMLTFTINFGEMDEEQRTVYYFFGWSDTTAIGGS